MAFKAKAPKSGMVTRVSNPRSRFLVLAAFAILVTLVGGGSRADSLATVVVRPFAFAVLAFAIVLVDGRQLRVVRVPLILLLCLAGLISLQLVPLPPSLWMALPGRAELAEIYRLAGQDLPWLPLALSPSRATNALMSLSVPLAAMAIFSVQDDSYRTRVWTILWVLVSASVILGMAQLAGSGGRVLYIHRITNLGLPVGLFANRNHQALFVCVGILLAAAKNAFDSRSRHRLALAATLSLGSLLVFFPFLLTVGSRAGLLIGSTLLFPAFALIYLAIKERVRRRKGKLNEKYIKAAFGLLVATAAAIFIAAIMFSRSLAFDRLIEKGGGDAIRGDTLPVIFDMTINSMPFGIGFGAFELAYRRVEPIDLLMPSYLNQAHNDWLQFVLEGGLPALVLLGGFVVWFMVSGVRVILLSRGELRPYGLAALGIILASGAASIVDYPLRTPTLAMVFAFACAQLAMDSRRNPVAARNGAS